MDRHLDGHAQVSMFVDTHGHVHSHVREAQVYGRVCGHVHGDGCICEGIAYGRLRQVPLEHLEGSHD